ncbi:MAG: H-NS histone family protein [Myxococcota bacterium]
MDLPALRALENVVSDRISALEAEHREAAFRALEEIAQRHGLTKAEVVARFRGRRNGKPKNPPRYRNPENPTETWTGVGRRPRWVEAQIAAGKALEELSLG